MRDPDTTERTHKDALARIEKLRALELRGLGWTKRWFQSWGVILLFGVYFPWAKPLWNYSLSECGDLLAGAIAVPAFFWLVLGYLQQAAALQLNSAELSQSVIEWKAQAAATARLAKATEDELAHRRIEIAPSPEVTEFEVIGDAEEKWVDLEVSNIGRTAQRIDVFDWRAVLSEAEDERARIAARYLGGVTAEGHRETLIPGLRYGSNQWANGAKNTVRVALFKREYGPEGAALVLEGRQISESLYGQVGVLTRDALGSAHLHMIDVDVVDMNGRQVVMHSVEANSTSEFFQALGRRSGGTCILEARTLRQSWAATEG